MRAEFSSQEEMISLFEPAYPSENTLRSIVNSDERRQSKRLRNAFGLPGYWIQPTMAQQLLNTIGRLETLELELGRGFEYFYTWNRLIINLHYKDFGAKVVIPPLALALNNPLTSLTRNRPKKFDKREDE